MIGSRVFIGARLRRSLLVGVGVAAVSLALASGALATTVIDTTTSPSWDGVSGTLFGYYYGLATQGQTVTVPATDTKLDSFTFELRLPTTMVFRGEVYAWNGSMATGSPLYESSPTHTTCNTNVAPCNASGYQPITFNTGGIDLTAGKQYVLFVSTSKDYNSASQDVGYIGTTLNPTYPGGGFFYMQNYGDSSLWTTIPWYSCSYCGTADAAFKASFSPPLPTSIAQCMNGGWQTYGFNNLGLCVAFVASRGKAPLSVP